jgi:hypothetical protein
MVPAVPVVPAAPPPAPVVPPPPPDALVPAEPVPTFGSLSAQPAVTPSSKASPRLVNRDFTRR